MLCRPLPVEPLSWTGVPGGLAHRPRGRWADVPPQRQRASPALDCLARAMDRRRVPTGPSETRPHPVDPRAGARRRTVRLAPPARRSLVAEVEGRRLHRRSRERGLGPCPPSPSALGHRPGARRRVRFPPPRLDRCTASPPGLRRSRTDGAQRVEHTDEDRAGGPPRLPGTVGRVPAVRLPRVRGVRLLQGGGCVGPEARGVRHVRRRRRQGTRGPHTTGGASRGGARDPLTLPPARVCIRHQGRGSVRSGVHRRAHAAETSEALVSSLPLHGVASHDVRHGPARPRHAQETERCFDSTPPSAPLRHPPSRRPWAHLVGRIETTPTTASVVWP
jgi:hypothetical protein